MLLSFNLSVFPESVRYQMLLLSLLLTLPWMKNQRYQRVECSELKSAECFSNDETLSSRDCLRSKLSKSLSLIRPLKLVKFSRNSELDGDKDDGSFVKTEDVEELSPSQNSVRSMSAGISTLSSLLRKGVKNFFGKYAVKIPLPQPSNEFPGILIEEEPSNVARQMPLEGRGRIKKDTKKYAMIFPIIATFKFMVIKALLITILVTVFTIKKLIVLTIMALPTLLAMLRVCRGGLFPPFGGLSNTAPAAAAVVGPLGPLAPYSATDAIVGDFSSYSHMTQSPYYARHDYGGRSYLPPSVD